MWGLLLLGLMLVSNRSDLWTWRHHQNMLEGAKNMIGQTVKTGWKQTNHLSRLYTTLFREKT